MSVTERELKAFNAVSELLLDLNSTFSKCKSISLFNKLIESTTFRDTKAIHRYIDSFKSFYSRNPKFVESKELGESPRIVYNERIYIDIDWVMRKIDNNDDRNTIHRHLVTIYSLLNDGKETKKALELLRKVDVNPPHKGNSVADQLNLPDTTEGDFIRESLNGIGELAKEIDLDSDTNPAEMISKVMNSDFFKNFAGSMQTKFQNGEIDAASLLKAVSGVVQDAGMGDEINNMLGGMGGLEGLSALQNMQGMQDMPDINNMNLGLQKDRNDER